jgi:sorbose reductase
MASNVETAKRTISDFTCEGKVALVTGGSRGLGYAFAQALAESGASVAILDIGEPAAEVLEKLRSFGVKAEFYKTNVADKEQVDKVVDQVKKDFEYLDIWYVASLSRSQKKERGIC